MRSREVGRFSISLTIALLAIGGCNSANRDADRRDAARVPEDAKFDKAVQVDPPAKLHVAAGDLAASQGKLDDAVEQYRKALAAEPSNPPAMYKLATLLSMGRRYDEAIALWQRYATATNNSTEAMSNLGRTYELAGRWREAEASYVSALRKDPSNATARLNYGILLAKRDRIDEAERNLAMVLRPSDVQYNLGSVAELKGDLSTARRRYTRALGLDPELAAAQQRLQALDDADAKVPASPAVSDVR